MYCCTVPLKVAYHSSDTAPVPLHIAYHVRSTAMYTEDIRKYTESSTCSRKYMYTFVLVYICLVWWYLFSHVLLFQEMILKLTVRTSAVSCNIIILAYKTVLEVPQEVCCHSSIKEENEQFPKLTKHIYHHARRRASFRGLFHVWL